MKVEEILRADGTSGLEEKRGREGEGPWVARTGEGPKDRLALRASPGRPVGEGGSPGSQGGGRTRRKVDLAVAEEVDGTPRGGAVGG